MTKKKKKDITSLNPLQSIKHEAHLPKFIVTLESVSIPPQEHSKVWPSNQFYRQCLIRLVGRTTTWLCLPIADARTMQL